MKGCNREIFLELSSAFNNLSSLHNLRVYSVSWPSSVPIYMSLSLGFLDTTGERNIKIHASASLCLIHLNDQYQHSKLLWVFKMHIAYRLSNFVVHIAQLWLIRGNEKSYINLKKVQHFCVLFSQGQVTHLLFADDLIFS